MTEVPLYHSPTDLTIEFEYSVGLIMRLPTLQGSRDIWPFFPSVAGESKKEQEVRRDGRHAVEYDPSFKSHLALRNQL